ncbi:hypothetical protein C5167_023154 [Papaver somniferum]|uniref:Uncharacterized protein n=1 Tax=Papaver somniferum TaxID=3469 RepID=A0A4Y7JJS2_PAPSO|nr:hypothetical protein C5167_023154 [Papaver somniferum]
MRASGKHPDHNVFPSVLKSCTGLMDFKLGESVHGSIIRLGVDADLYTESTLGKWWCYSAATERYGYVHNGMCEEALRTVREIGKTNLMPDSFTLSSILPIFAEYVDISRGKEIHGMACLMKV